VHIFGHIGVSASTKHNSKEHKFETATQAGVTFAPTVARLARTDRQSKAWGMRMITISGDHLTVEDIVAVAKGAEVRITADPAVLARVAASCQRIEEALARHEPIYGVTSLYGGMADKSVPEHMTVELQRVALITHRNATGPLLLREEVRAAMLLRANSLLKGYSAVRLEVIGRYVVCLNAALTPHAHRLGSIGASGDLIPLSYIGASVLGLDPAFLVDLDGETLSCVEGLARIGLHPLAPRPKEGLALNNGTNACTGVTALCIERVRALYILGFGVQALMFQALRATSQSFHPAVHAVKPHPGQVFVAACFRDLLAGSRLVRDESGGARDHRAQGLLQDRYSLRCLPQFTGPIIDAWAVAARQIETEANSANDNPLIDPESGEVYHTGNFLAQYTATAADSLRLHLAMLIKHLDVQIAMLVAPEFNQGLAASLVGNVAMGLNIGLKSLQIHCNSLAPLVQYHARPIADLFPTHAEQFNQNINSQGMNAANLTRDSVDVAEQFMACAMIFALQAIELRARAESGRFDASELLSPATRTLYQVARNIAGGRPDAETSLIWDDIDAAIQPRIEALLRDVRGPRLMLRSLSALSQAFDTFQRP
jgi:phenylalanine ammonia-lyase